MSDDVDVLLGRRTRPRLTGIARKRLWLARPLVTLVQLPLPVLLVTQATVDFPPGRDGDWSVVAGPVLTLLICLWRWRRGRYRPYGWPRTALWMNGVAGLYLGVAWDRNAISPVVTGMFIGAAAPLAAAGVGWSLAVLARRLVLAPFTVELADSPLELVFHSRDDPRNLLRIRHDEISVDRSPPARLDDVGPVAQFVDETGPAVRFEVLGDTWTFPTDQGAEIAEVIQRRRPVPASPLPPPHLSGDSGQEPAAVGGEKIMRRRHEANLRVAQAVKALQDARATQRAAARAALRELCDQTIAELIDGADLLVPGGRLMLRQDAARIRRIRDRYCGPVDST